MQNIGEEIAGEYLRVCKGCEFVQYNLYTTGVQGEIDVVGLCLKNKTAYFCEVATHLQTGLQYTKDRKPNNVGKFIKKFEKNINYANKYFADYTKIYMLWSPVIRQSRETSKNSQTRDISEIQKYFKDNHNVEIEAIINHKYSDCLNELKKHALKTTQALKSSVLRCLQIDEHLKKHLKRVK